MKHFIIEITYTASPEEVAEVLPDHRNFLALGYEQGRLLFSGPQLPKKGGIIVARDRSLEEIQTFFADDPYQTRGVATYRFIEFEPVKRQEFLEDWVRSETFK
jgi:uncharacterized protein YciI